MAEVEIGEMKITGGKMLVLVPLLGTIIGGLWGGFELYQRLLTAEEAIVNYVSPDFSHYDESLAVLVEQISALEEDVDDLKQEVDRIEDLARDVDNTTADTQRELRDDVYALEERVNESLREADEQIREVRKELEDKIEKILENPLNDTE